jgi:chorismate mutase
MTREDMQIMTARGIRGATSVEENTRQSILSNTRELLSHMMQANGFNVEDLVCAFFTTTQDLNADFPAAGARELGWTDIALLCGHEMDVPGSLQGVLRVMIIVNTDKSAKEITHVYLKEARRLRPDHKGATDTVQ